ncbi:putative ribonuclease H-like domain-containing protein [Tanacetum coccineum]|uniref:Ribonuclease H-like domain-containing protein n=1 Tax=Tanacetum coccineum TaxID=301880 RepID=A0ABQ5HVV0_9ASTR
MGCRGPRNQDSKNWNQDNSRKTVNVEETSSKAMLAIDGASFDWSYMADVEVHTNMALMAFSYSEFNKSEFNLATYKRGLASVEEQPVFYKKNKLEKIKQEKESIQLKIGKFDNASKRLFSPPNLDLPNSGLEGFQQPEFEGYRPKTSKSVSEDISNEVRKYPDAPLVEKLVSNDKLEKRTVFPAKIEFVKPKQQEKPVTKPVKLTAITIKGKGWYLGVIIQGPKAVNTARPNSAVVNAVRANQGHPQKEDQGYVDSGCSRHMTGNMSYLSDFKEFDGGYVTFRGGAKGGRITGKGILKTNKLDFENVYFVKELQFNFFSVSQMCDKKNSVLFTDTRCFVLSHDFKLANESQVLLKVPKKNNMYNVDMKNIVPKEGLTCLVAKDTLDESMLWHRRLGHVSFKTINKLVKDNLVKGLPIKRFENDQTFVACLKGKQHKASCKSKIQNSITQPLFMLHMDLFGPTFVSSLMKKKYCLVVTGDYSRFTWVSFLASKDETSGILKSFITQIENLVDKKVKIIRYDNGTEFKNRVMSEFYKKKGIKREYSIARTPQQNGVAERRNRKLIEAARTMVLVVSPHNKTPYELFKGRTHDLSFIRAFGCHVIILNTLDHLGKFHGKSDDGFILGYSLNSKAFRVYNTRTRKVEENLHVRFLDDKPIIAGDGRKWLFDIDVLTKSMNYVPVVVGSSQNYILMPLWKDGSLFDSSSKNSSNDEPQPYNDAGKKDDDGGIDDQERTENCTRDVNNARPMDMGNITTTYLVPSTLNTRIHKDYSLDHVIGDIQYSVQTRRMINEQGFISAVYEEETHEDLQNCLFACFLSQVEPKKTLVDLPYGKRAIGTKWVYKNKKDKRAIMIRNKAMLVAQGYTQEEGIDYDEVFAPVARIEAIRLFLAYESFKDFVVYQMDVKSAFLYGKIEEEVYVCQSLGFEDPEFPNKVYKRGQIDKTLFIKRVKDDILLVQVYVDDIIFGSTKKEMCTEFEKMMHKRFQISSMGELTFFLGLQIARTPMETSKPLLKDTEAEDVDVHLYRSMIGSLMYLTASRPDIMFDVCACTRFQVTPKGSHLHAMKRIFRYLKGQPKLGLWYPKDSPFDLEAYTDSDYAGASLDRNSTTGEYVAATSCYGQVLWIQNEMLDYGYNFMNTKIFIDNESTICIVKNLVFHLKTKHIKIRHHFIRDSNEKKLIQMIKIHTDLNVADLFTKAFNVGRF